MCKRRLLSLKNWEKRWWFSFSFFIFCYAFEEMTKSYWCCSYSSIRKHLFILSQALSSNCVFESFPVLSWWNIIIYLSCVLFIWVLIVVRYQVLRVLCRETRRWLWRLKDQQKDLLYPSFYLRYFKNLFPWSFYLAHVFSSIIEYIFILNFSLSLCRQILMQ